jgi:hypothetical protein
MPHALCLSQEMSRGLVIGQLFQIANDPLRMRR